PRQARRGKPSRSGGDRAPRPPARTRRDELSRESSDDGERALRPWPVFAGEWFDAAAKETAENDGDDEHIVELSGDRDEVRNEVERQSEICDEPDEERLLAARHARVLHQPAAKHDASGAETRELPRRLATPGDHERERQAAVEEDECADADQAPRPQVHRPKRSPQGRAALSGPAELPRAESVVVPMAIGAGTGTLGWTMGEEALQVKIAGAGVAALEAALALQALSEGRVSVDLIAPETEFTYRPLAVAEPFSVAEVKRFRLDRLVRAAGAGLRAGSVVAVDADRKTLRLA